jgi:Arm DNA-binding domain/Phage integrase family
MARKVTALTIANMKAGAVRREVPAGNGLYVICQPSGKKSFALRYRRPQDGRTAKLTLGNGSMTLAAARRAAATALHEVEQGRDPAFEKKVAQARTRVAAANTLEAVCRDYLRLNAKRLRTIADIERVLQRHVFPRIGDRPVSELKRSEIARLLDAIEIGSGPRMADRTKTTLSAVMSWYTPRADDDFVSPVVRTKPRRDPQEGKRDRILDDEELRRVWNAAGTQGPYGKYVRFLLLTATRRDEAARMTRNELINGDWEIPAVRYKSKRPHLIPLSSAARKIVDGMPVINGSDWVFTITGRRPVSTRGPYKRALDEASDVTNWRLHDLRRTARSLMSRAGVRPDIGELCLGHVIGGVRGIYDRHQYRDEKARAFEALGALVGLIVEPPQDNVTPLRA